MSQESREISADALDQVLLLNEIQRAAEQHKRFLTPESSGTCLSACLDSSGDPQTESG